MDMRIAQILPELNEGGFGITDANDDGNDRRHSHCRLAKHDHRFQLVS